MDLSEARFISILRKTIIEKQITYNDLLGSFQSNESAYGILCKAFHKKNSKQNRKGLAHKFVELHKDVKTKLEHLAENVSIIRNSNYTYLYQKIR